MPGIRRGRVRTKSAINNTQASGYIGPREGVARRGIGAEHSERSTRSGVPGDPIARYSANYDATCWRHKYIFNLISPRLSAYWSGLSAKIFSGRLMVKGLYISLILEI